MTYTVKEIFYSLQGEGRHAGRPSVFCRFAGCNLWSGREEDRATAICWFCDTDFVGSDGDYGGKYISASDLARRVASLWPPGVPNKLPPYVVCTGGEPLLQVDKGLVDAFHEHGFEVAIESNGTIGFDFDVDWLCVSPKAGTTLALRSGNELKLIFPQEHAGPSLFEGLDFEEFYLQPMDGPDLRQNTELAVHYCMEHPQWKLSLQLHKLVGLP